MIQIRFEEREKIGLQYILESLHGCSPFGQERIRRLRYYTPDEREELEQELVSLDGISSLTRIEDTRKTFGTSLESVDYAVALIIVCAAALAFADLPDDAIIEL